jgi:hypothetical protein
VDSLLTPLVSCRLLRKPAQGLGKPADSQKNRPHQRSTCPRHTGRRIASFRGKSPGNSPSIFLRHHPACRCVDEPQRVTSLDCSNSWCQIGDKVFQWRLKTLIRQKEFRSSIQSIIGATLIFAGTEVRPSCVISPIFPGISVNVIPAAFLGFPGSGACQGSCRLGYAAEADSFSLATASLTTDSRSGLSVTAAIGCQLRVCRVQRRGLAARACRYRSCRRARMS